MGSGQTVRVVRSLENLANCAFALAERLLQVRPGLIDLAILDEFIKGFLSGLAFVFLGSSLANDVSKKGVYRLASKAILFMQHGERRLLEHLQKRPLSDNEAVLPHGLLAILMKRLVSMSPGLKQDILRVYWEYFQELVCMIVECDSIQSDIWP